MPGPESRPEQKITKRTQQTTLSPPHGRNDYNVRMRFVAALLLCTPFSLFAIDDPVRISNGSLSGTLGRSLEVRVYKGIPYASPPVGSLRWKTPKSAATWEGVRKADAFSPACMQTPYPSSSIYHSEPEPVSEDCLYLNLWTAAKSPRERRPVMVWIHGGALTRGSGFVGVYDGESLAKKGVVVVTINYRLGIFGFLAHPELTRESDHNASGNYGLLDQITALEWVQKNIAAFGGDPKRVTIFGESAGSWSVNYLMATPLANGLFQRAIGESGAAFESVKTLAETEATGVKFAKSMGADTIAALRAKPAEEILKSSAFASFPPNVDGWMLPHDVYTIFAAGKQNDVPILIGSNADEAKSLTMWPSSGSRPAARGRAHARGENTMKLTRRQAAGALTGALGIAQIDARQTPAAPSREMHAVWAGAGDAGTTVGSVRAFVAQLKRANIHQVVMGCKQGDGSVVWHRRRFPQLISPRYQRFRPGREPAPEAHAKALRCISG